VKLASLAQTSQASSMVGARVQPSGNSPLGVISIEFFAWIEFEAEVLDLGDELDQGDVRGRIRVAWASILRIGDWNLNSLPFVIRVFLTRQLGSSWRVISSLPAF